jgi:hypothetical protein
LYSPKRRLDLGQPWFEASLLGHEFPQEARQVELLVFDVQAELEVLRVDPADTHIGDVAHRAHSQGNVESRFTLGTMRAFQVSEPLHPPGPVIVFRIETFCVGPPEYFNHRGS